MRVVELSLKEINIPKRFREDLGNIAELAESLKHKGLIQPITVDEKYSLVAGGRRLAAAKEAGLESISAIIRPIADELDAREVELFENLHRKDMTWQEQIKITTKIHELLLDKHKDNWSKAATARLLNKSRASVSDAVELSQAIEILPDLGEMPTADAARKSYKRAVEDAVVKEALKEAKTKNQKKAIIWASDHYVVADVFKRIGVIADEVMNFAEVDPPYAIDLKAQRKKETQDLKNYNEVSKKDYPSFIDELAKQTFRVLDRNSFCVWWFGPTWHQQVLLTLRRVGFHVDDIPAIWYKPSGGVSNNPDTYLARCYEPFFVCRKGNPVLRLRGHSNVYPFPGVPTSQRIHPTERPIEMMQEILRTFVYPGARVIIPLLGSGNTLLACYKEGMVGFGYDKSELYRDGFLTRVAKEFPKDFNPIEQRM